MTRPSSNRSGCESAANCTDISQHLWGQYSPFFSVPSDVDSSTPIDCTVTFVQVLSRHGSRFPTSRKSRLYEDLIGRIHSSVTDYPPGLDFMHDFAYDLGRDQLTRYGEEEMVASGRAAYQRYTDLASSHEPFIRASGSDRVILSARNFTQGLYEGQEGSGAKQADSILILPEEGWMNNTLSEGGCPKFEDSKSGIRLEKKGAWRDTWVPPIQERLNRKLPGANLTLDEVIYVMDLCAFNTVADRNGRQSDFCKIFSHEEWRGYDYYCSLDKWYGYGPGNPLGPSLGVGFVNELVARLTGQPVNDGTRTNHTLDRSNDTFPLGRGLYADFSHDSLMTSVYGAMGLYDATRDLPVKYVVPPTQTGGYSASWTVPFAARMYVEKMQCGGDGRQWVRVLVNDRVMALNTCQADHLGRCELDAFIESLSFARHGGHWDECFT